MDDRLTVDNGEQVKLPLVLAVVIGAIIFCETLDVVTAVQPFAAVTVTV